MASEAEFAAFVQGIAAEQLSDTFWRCEFPVTADPSGPQREVYIEITAVRRVIKVVQVMTKLITARLDTTPVLLRDDGTVIMAGFGYVPGEADRGVVLMKTILPLLALHIGDGQDLINFLVAFAMEGDAIDRAHGQTLYMR